MSWSVTQNWQTVALGMPRLCSAKRLVDGMVEEIFGLNPSPGGERRAYAVR